MNKVRFLKASAKWLSVLSLAFVASTVTYAAASSSQIGLTLYYPGEGVDEVAYTHQLSVKRVHPHVAIHVFQPSDGFWYLNHGLDTGGRRYYNAILFTTYGKTYVTLEPMTGPIVPASQLTSQDKEMLELQLSEIDRHGGVAPYIDQVLLKRGWFPPTH